MCVYVFICVIYSTKIKSKNKMSSIKNNGIFHFRSHFKCVHLKGKKKVAIFFFLVTVHLTFKVVRNRNLVYFFFISNVINKQMTLLFCVFSKQIQLKLFSFARINFKNYFFFCFFLSTSSNL